MRASCRGVLKVGAPLKEQCSFTTSSIPRDHYGGQGAPSADGGLEKTEPLRVRVGRQGLLVLSKSNVGD